MQPMAMSWLKFEKRSICLVDWKAFASTEYTISANNHTKTVGSYIAELIRKQYFDAGETVIAGHSLGAHIAGFCGKALNGSLSTIYGLDPAGPQFTDPTIVDSLNRLGPGDAKHVQCIHTNGGKLGTHLPCGDSDYYPSIGSKPGCSSSVCYHNRAIFLFESSMNPDHMFIGKHCENDENGKRGTCSKKIDQMGIHGKHLMGQFYFKTTSCYPYCL